jgi:hypothetical protein
MESATLLGFVLVVIAGLGTGSCLWPMRLIRGFRFEQCWFIAMLFGLVLIPWGIVLGAIRDPWTAYAAAGGERLLVSNLFAIAWGIANVLAGICALRIGFSLSGSILTGVGLMVSVVVPMIFPRMFTKAPELMSSAGRMIMLGMAVILAGVALSAMAGFGRERAIRARAEPVRWASGGFLGGLLLAILAGVLSAGMQLANAYGHDAIVGQMSERGVALVPREMSFWAVGLLGGALVNVFYPTVLMSAKKSWNVLAKHPGEVLLSLVIGGQLMLALAILGYGRAQMGRFGDSQAAGVQLAMQIIGGLVVGFLAGEWRGVPRKPKIQLCAAFLVLLVGAVLIKYAETM